MKKKEKLKVINLRDLNKELLSVNHCIDSPIKEYGNNISAKPTCTVKGVHYPNSEYPCTTIFYDCTFDGDSRTYTVAITNCGTGWVGGSGLNWK